MKLRTAGDYAASANIGQLARLRPVRGTIRAQLGACVPRHAISHNAGEYAKRVGEEAEELATTSSTESA